MMQREKNWSKWTKKQKEEYTSNEEVEYHLLSVLPMHKINRIDA